MLEESGTSSGSSDVATESSDVAPASSERRRAARVRLVKRGVTIAIGIAIAFEVVQESRHARRHLSRAASGWWAGVERRDRRRVVGAEVGVLLRLLSPGH